RAEDTLIVHGYAGEGLSLPGLLTVDGRISVPLTDWKTGPGAAFENVVQATERLVLSGFSGPYALLCSPSLYASLLRVYPQTQILEIEQIRRLVSAGVYQSSVLLGDSAVLVANGAENLDLVVGQDLTTGYLGPVDLNHDFRVLESVALRIKRPGAICVFGESTSAPPSGPTGRRRAGG
ncbi:MAG TPA: family 1 encapsulin nanocompartment shell protein, partial [Planctomycetaceae bacterium]